MNIWSVVTQQAKVSNSSDQVSPKENSYNENKKCHRRACPNCASTKNTFEATAVVGDSREENPLTQKNCCLFHCWYEDLESTSEIAQE